jgi:hypothetical protein
MPVTSRHIILRANDRRSAPPHTHGFRLLGNHFAGPLIATEHWTAGRTWAISGEIVGGWWKSLAGIVCVQSALSGLIRPRDMAGSCQPREAKDCALQVYRFWWLIDDQWQKCGLLASRDHVMTSAYASPYLICHRKPPLLLHLPDWSRLTNADLIAPRS